MDNKTHSPAPDAKIVAALAAALPDGKDISSEQWREYQWHIGAGQNITYRITDPVALYVGNTTHRVLDSEGVVHCVPNVGHFGCALRWKVKDGATPVRF